jgi:hypothetical protein
MFAFESKNGHFLKDSVPPKLIAVYYPNRRAKVPKDMDQKRSNLHLYRQHKVVVSEVCLQSIQSSK